MKKCFGMVLAAAAMLSMGTTAFAESNSQVSSDIVIPTNSFDYYGTDVDASINSGISYRTSNAYFRDEADIFSFEQEERISRLIQDTADNIGMNVAVFIGGNRRTDKETENFATDASVHLFGNAADTNSVFIYMDFEGEKSAYDYISTQHDARLYYNESGRNNRINSIIKNMEYYLPESGNPVHSENVYKAVDTCCTNLISYKNAGMANDAQYYNEELGSYRTSLFGRVWTTSFPVPNTPVVISIFVILGLMILSVISGLLSPAKRHYSSSRHHHKSHRSHSSSRSSGSHHSSSGGHSSGGSFGGGGGHR